MGKVKFGAAFAFACLGAASASAASVRINDGHAGADFGVGGWTQNFSAKTVASGAVSIVSNATGEAVSNAASVAVHLPSDVARRDLADLRHRPIWLRADADCVFVSSTTSAGNRWRPACK
jgi:hypothetical protein